MKTNVNVIGVIPARYESTRLPHKLLRTMAGKTLLQWTWENASRAHMLDELIIACDHNELEGVAKGFGAEVVNTSPQHQSGTDRIAEAVRDVDAKVIINIQADEPLVNPSVIDRLAQEVLCSDNIGMASVKKKIEDEKEIADPNVVKVICDKDGFALYFSRHALPYYRNSSDEKSYYKHMGIYAYTKDFLFTFKNLPFSYLENAENLEQLRALEAGYKIKILETQFDSCGVDTEGDLAAVEDILTKRLRQP
jgi:3-deoxy-manno-octulosonate cytidylyltransferase (CMP-KDO synthetase)